MTSKKSDAPSTSFFGTDTSTRKISNPLKPTKKSNKIIESSYSDMKVNIEEKSGVHLQCTENSKSVFNTNLKNSASPKESVSEKESAYARKCVEFLDILDFDDDKLSEETLKYIDSSL